MTNNLKNSSDSTHTNRCELISTEFDFQDFFSLILLGAVNLVRPVVQWTHWSHMTFLMEADVCVLYVQPECLSDTLPLSVTRMLILNLQTCFRVVFKTLKLTWTNIVFGLFISSTSNSTYTWNVGCHMANHWNALMTPPLSVMTCDVFCYQSQVQPCECVNLWVGMKLIYLLNISICALFGKTTQHTNNAQMQATQTV